MNTADLRPFEHEEITTSICAMRETVWQSYVIDHTFVIDFREK